jgi:hypothetical protein
MTFFCQQVLHSLSRFLIAALVSAVACQPLQAQTITTDDIAQYQANCQVCHGSPLRMASDPSQPYPNSYRILTWAALDVMGSDAEIVTAMTKKSLLSNGEMKNDYFDRISNLGSSELLSIHKYLRAVRDAVVSGSPPKISNTAVGSSNKTSVEITITNYRGALLNKELTVSSTVGNEFTLVSQSTSSGCIGNVPAAASSTSPTTCTINATVKFQPTAVGTRTGSLRLALTAPSSSDTQPPVKDIVLSAEAVTPFTTSATTLNFNTTAGSPAVRSARLANTGDANLTITGLTLSAQAIAANYTLAPANGCTVGQSLAANGGSCSLGVLFSPSTAVQSTPNATLTIQHSAFGSPTVIALNGVATIIPRAFVELSIPSLPAFDAQVGNTSAKQTIVVHNSGDAALQFTSLNLDGAGGPEFERGGTCATGMLLAVGPANSATSCTIELSFRPTATGTRNATLTIESNANNNPVVLALSGNGVPVPAPSVELSPGGQLEFGSQTVGGIYPTRSIKLTNAGNAALSIASLVVESAAFLDASASPCPATLASGASCVIDIAFRPTATAVDFVGSLRVASNAPGSPHSVALAGHGTTSAIPVLEWLPPVRSELDFGLVSAGTASATQSVTFVNRGPGGVNFSVVNAVGTDASAFSVVTSNCAVGVPYFQDIPCRLDITFSPGSSGNKTATLQIVSSGSSLPALKLTGSGLSNPAADLAVSAAALDFEPTRLGAQSAPSELTLSGTGAGAVNIIGLQISGPYVLQSKTCSKIPFLLDAGSSCTLTVSFQPQSEGSAAGTLRITTDATTAMRVITLNGTGHAQANVSGGGCSMASGDTPLDPTLWALVLLAIAALSYRHRARAAQRRR